MVDVTERIQNWFLGLLNTVVCSCLIFAVLSCWQEVITVNCSFTVNHQSVHCKEKVKYYLDWKFLIQNVYYSPATTLLKSMIILVVLAKGKIRRQNIYLESQNAWSRPVGKFPTHLNSTSESFVPTNFCGLTQFSVYLSNAKQIVCIGSRSSRLVVSMLFWLKWTSIY